MPKQSKRPSLTLLDESAGGQVWVKPKDDDHFFVALMDAVSACRAIDKAKEFQQQFEDLVDELTKWIDSHKDSIRSAHLMARERERDILLLVVQKDVPFDRVLADELSKLDISIAQSKNFNLLDLNVMAVPSVSRESMTAFLASGDVYTYAK